jgi:hypothetical protein
MVAQKAMGSSRCCIDRLIPLAETHETKMPATIALEREPKLEVFNQETLIKGKSAQVECVEIGGQTFTITKGPLAMVRLEDEWYEDVRDPDVVIDALKNAAGFKPDIFTFWQRVPNVEQQYQYHNEWESIAALPVRSYDHWFNKQISSRLRSQLRKATKEGLNVREAAYDDEFVRGMTDIFNETPIRQGRRFWHYGKDFETVKQQFSRYLFREEMIGAYCGGEMIGFIMLGNAGNYGITGQIISKLKYRDKVTNNALIGKAVEVCAKKNLPYLVYFHWTNDSLAEFKRRCGFGEIKVPRYFVPLTKKGKLTLKLGLHRGWKTVLPGEIKGPLKKLRKFWYGLKRD